MALRMVSSFRIAETRAGRFAGRAQTAIEALEHRVVMDGDEAGHVEQRSDLEAFLGSCAAISAGVVIDRRDAGRGGDLVAVDDITDTGYAFHEVLLGAPSDPWLQQSGRSLLRRSRRSWPID